MQIKKMITMSLFGLMMCASMNTVEASCAKGKGTEIKGNSSGTYCMSRIGMNWWSAHAWCNAIEMKLITVDECDCTDEIKCDMTIACPNLHFPNISANAWTTMPFGSGVLIMLNFPPVK